jgi:transposase-like protein
MRRKGKFSAEERLKYVLRCIEGKYSIKHTSAMIGIHPESLRQWIKHKEINLYRAYLTDQREH